MDTEITTRTTEVIDGKTVEKTTKITKRTYTIECPGSTSSSWSAPSSQSYSSISSSGKRAIVPAGAGYVSLYCTESPELICQDVVTITPTEDITEITLDPVFLKVCEPDSILVTMITTDSMAVCGADISGGKLRVRIRSTSARPKQITATVRGIRRGCKGMRFTPATRDQMLVNDRFWSTPLS